LARLAPDGGTDAAGMPADSANQAWSGSQIMTAQCAHRVGVTLQKGPMLVAEPLPFLATGDPAAGNAPCGWNAGVYGNQAAIVHPAKSKL